MNATAWLLIAVAVVLALADMVAVLWLPYGNTVSITLYEAARRHPVVAFALGFLLGHIFWPTRADP